MLPALEIIDSRIADWKISLVDTIADNASSGGVVLGSTPGPRWTRSTCGWPAACCTATAALAGTGAGGAVLGSPLNALVWLANTLGAARRRAGGRARGAARLHAPRPSRSRPGDTVTAAFAGSGSVTARFT